MAFVKKLRQICKNMFRSKYDVSLVEEQELDLPQRMDRLERNYIILLKRMLEIDGFHIRTQSFTNKVLRTPNDELNKGLNEPEPTIH